jgi:mannitol-1-phosphate/altronate dehydrogenase
LGQQVRHLHFGAGKLGLGLVGSLSQNLALDFTLANRGLEDTNGLSDQNLLIARNACYDVEYYSGERETIAVSRFFNFSDPADRAALIDLISDHETKLVTISLGGKHGTISDVLAKGLIARSAKRAEKVYVLACENGVTSRELRESVLQHTAEPSQIDASAEFVPCVVDRVCDAIKTSSDRVVVCAERLVAMSTATVAKKATSRDWIAAISGLPDVVIMPFF